MVCVHGSQESVDNVCRQSLTVNSQSPFCYFFQLLETIISLGYSPFPPLKKLFLMSIFERERERERESTEEGQRERGKHRI